MRDVDSHAAAVGSPRSPPRALSSVRSRPTSLASLVGAGPVHLQSRRLGYGATLPPRSPVASGHAVTVGRCPEHDGTEPPPTVGHDGGQARARWPQTADGGRWERSADYLTDRLAASPNGWSSRLCNSAVATVRDCDETPGAAHHHLVVTQTFSGFPDRRVCCPPFRILPRRRDLEGPRLGFSDRPPSANHQRTRPRVQMETD